MSSVPDQSEIQFLRTLQRIQPAVIQELIDAAGVTATAVRHRLTRLQERGWVDRVTLKQERGRPSHQYRLTPAGVKVLGDETTDLAVLLWKEIQSLPNSELRVQLLSRIRESLIGRLGTVSPVDSLSERVEQLCGSLEGRGLMVESEFSGALPIIREHSCPYHAVAQVDTAICEMEQEAFSHVLGVPVELSACRLDGHRCCEFQVGVPS